MVVACGEATGLPSRQLRAMAGAPAAQTPTIFVCGERAFIQQPAPLISASLPTGSSRVTDSPIGQFYGDGSGALGNARIVAVFDEQVFGMPADISAGLVLGRIEIIPDHDHLGSEFAHPEQLGRVGGGRCEYRHSDPARTARVGDGLTEVSGRRAHYLPPRRDTAQK
jgi:hypothetical protein